LHIATIWSTIELIKRNELKNQVRLLRQRGKTYSEIKNILAIDIPKSTLSYWCKNIGLPNGYADKIDTYNKFNLEKARKVALANHKIERDKYLKSVSERNRHLETVLKNKDVAKIALAVLYLGEGSKCQRGSLMFGNSDPFIVSLFCRW